MVWEKGEIYTCPNSTCGLEVVVSRGSKHVLAGTQTLVCLCGARMERKVPPV